MTMKVRKGQWQVSVRTIKYQPVPCERGQHFDETDKVNPRLRSRSRRLLIPETRLANMIQAGSGCMGDQTSDRVINQKRPKNKVERIKSLGHDIFIFP